MSDAARARRGFIELSLQGLRVARDHGSQSEATSRSAGLLQGLDPRVKTLGLPLLMSAAAFSSDLRFIGALFALGVGLAVASRISWRLLALGLWPGLLLFTACLEFPALWLTPGPPLGHLALFGWPLRAWGVHNALLVTSRVETSATFGTLLVLCTPWTQVLKALRVFQVPVVAVAILGMTHRYIFVFIETALAMFESRRSRTIGKLPGPERRRMTAAAAGVLLSKSIRLSEEVHLAMRSRGYQGDLRVLEEFQMRWRDWVAVALLSTSGILWLVLR